MKKRKVRITNTGYLPDSPDKHNDMNIIPSNQITMKKVPFPILGIDNMGNRQMMMPGGEYSFPGQYVTEIPMGKYQGGGSNFKTKLSAEEEEQFKKFFQTLPDNLRADDSMYDIRGYWDASGRPEEFDYSQPTQEDGYYHAFSRHPETGKILKAPTHPTFNYAVDKTPLGDDTYVPLIGVDGNVYMRDLNWDSKQAFEEDKYQKGGQRRVVYTDPEEFKIANQAYRDSSSLHDLYVAHADYIADNRAPVAYDYDNAVPRMKRDKLYFGDAFKYDQNDVVGEKISNVQQRTGYLPIGQRVFYPNTLLSTYDYIFKKPETKPVLQEAPLYIEPKPLTKLPVPESTLVPYDLPKIKENQTTPIMQSSYAHRKGQYQIGENVWNEDKKKWERRMFKDEEADWYRNNGKIKKDGGLTKFVNGGPKEKGWREYKTATGQSFYLDPRFKDQRYYVDEKGNHVTPDQNMSLFDVKDNIWESGTSLPTLKISAEEATPFLASIPEDVKTQMLNQGEIKPATEGTERLKNQFIYAMDQPLDAMGSLMQRGYVPQGNLNGDYETASPMSSVIGAFNPASVIMDVGRVGRDAFEKETYTTLGGAGEAGLNVAGFLPFGSIVQKGLKKLPKVYDNRNIGEFFVQNNLGKSLDDIELEDYANLERRSPLTLDRTSNQTGYTRADQMQEFKNAEDFAKKWAYNEEALNTYEKEIIPKRKKLVEDYDAKLTKIEEDSNKLKDEAFNIDKMLDDPNNSENFDKLHKRYNQLINEKNELDRLHNATRIEQNKLADELTNSVNIYDKDFEKKALDIINSERDDVSKNTRLFNKKFDTSRNKLVYYDKLDPSYKNLNATEQLYLDGNVDRIGGSRMQDSTISLATEGRPLITTHLVTEKLPWSLSNPFGTKKKQYLQEVQQNVLIDPRRVGHVNAHEIAHDLQKLNEWSLVLADYDPAYNYYTSNSNTKLGNQFKDALVSPDVDPWLSAPIELHSELMGTRYQAVKNMMEEHGLTMDQAIKVLKEDRDDYTDYLIELGDLNKHFKPEVTQEEKRRLIKMLPAVVPAIGAGYVGSQLYNNQQQEPTYRQGGMYLGKYEFKDGGLVKIQNELDTYANGGKIVSELWVEKTGLPWSAAKQMGLSDGSYDRNIQLREELIKGQYDNLNKNPKARTVQQRTTPVKQVVKPAPQVSRKPETVSKPLSTKYGVYNWSQNLPQKNKQDQGQQVFDKEFSTTTRGTLPELKQDPSYKFPTFAEFQEQKRRSVLTATQPRSTSGTLPTKNENSEVPKKDQAYYDLLNSTKIEFNADAESTARTFNRPISPDSLERNKNIQDLLLKDEVAKSQRTTLTAGEPSLLDKMTEAFNDVKESAGEAYEYAAQELADYKESATKKLEEYGILTPSTEGNLIKFEQPKQQVQPKDSVNYYIPPTQVTEDNNADYGEADNKFWGFRYQNSNDSGLVYVPTPRREKLNKDSKFSNVKGVAHFLIQTDATDGFIDPGTKWQLDKDLKSNKYVPFIKKEADGKVRLKYAKGNNEYKNFAEEGYEPFTTLRTLNLSDIDWNKTARPYHNVQAAQADGYKRTGKGMFGKGISNVLTKDGKDTWLVFKDATGKGNKLGQFNGGALVFIIETPNGRVIRDFTGTIQDIENESKNIVKEFKVPAKNVTLGFYDAGSYTAKPKANENNELYFNQYSGFNKADKLSGAALMIPANLEQGGQTLQRHSKGGNTTTQGIYLGKYEFKDGGLVKAQRGKQMPFDLPLKEQNIYLLPEYNQPRNPKTGEILPDPQRPNLGMGTGATEYKYTYGSDEGDIDVPSIVAGQYIGDRALDRYMLTGERFKTMIDPGSYSKFYDQTNRLGLMREKNGGSVRKVKIKSLPRKNQ